MIELLVVIAIIGVLSSVVLGSLNVARQKSRDARRIQDMRQIQTAVELYRDKFGVYPDSDMAGCGNWDTPGNGDFVKEITTKGFYNGSAKDPTTNDNCGNYRYYRYVPGSYGCDLKRGYYYVLMVVDLETSSGPVFSSQGFKCSGRDWQGEADWVTGNYEN